MDRRIYNAAMLADLNDLENINKYHIDFEIFQPTPNGNNILHVTCRYADRSGSKDRDHDQEKRNKFAAEILQKPAAVHLLSQQNSDLDTPLHVAARAASVELIELLIKACIDIPEHDEEIGIKDEGEGRIPQGMHNPILWMKNSNKNMPLHEALIRGNEPAALFLLRLENRLTTAVDGHGDRPLYVACQQGMLKVVQYILDERRYRLRCPDDKDLLVTAITRNHYHVTGLLLQKKRELANEVDDSGRNALHHAAEYCPEAAYHLPFTDKRLAYAVDEGGFTPLLTAIRSNSKTAVKNILSIAPESVELCGLNKRNALHIAVEYCSSSDVAILEDLLADDATKWMANQWDGDENTPLHFAVNKGKFQAVKALLRSKDVDLNIRNKDGLTALEMIDQDTNFKLQEHVEIALNERRVPVYTENEKYRETLLKLIYPLKNPDMDLNSMASTMSLVATLLGTVTFAAAFTVPGGLQNGMVDDDGSPVFARRTALKVFLVTDAIAMCISITVAFIFIWASCGLPELLRRAIRYGIGLLLLALFCTMVAFATGIYVVFEQDERALAIVIVVLCCGFPLILYALVHFGVIAIMATRSPGLIKWIARCTTYPMASAIENVIENAAVCLIMAPLLLMLLPISLTLGLLDKLFGREGKNQVDSMPCQEAKGGITSSLDCLSE